VHAFDQWLSSRVSTPLTGWHCKLRPNTEGRVAAGLGTVLVCRKLFYPKMTLDPTPVLREANIQSHPMVNGMHLGGFTSLPVDAVNSVDTLKVCQHAT
jgi:hypothetical protein